MTNPNPFNLKTECLANLRELRVSVATERQIRRGHGYNPMFVPRPLKNKGESTLRDLQRAVINEIEIRTGSRR